MPALFVSHSDHGGRAVEECCARLRAEGFHALFVDFDPDHGIPAGRVWEPEVYAQLRKADGVVFLATPASIASQWCSIELGIARSSGKPVFPVLVSGTKRHPLLENVQWIDMTSEGDRAYGRLLDGLRLAGLDPADAFDWDQDRSPYPGLEPFGIEDAAVFFGRDAQIDRLLQFLQTTLRHVDGRFVGIVGPSGSGKSSLLHAGLLPRLHRIPERWIVVPAFQPGQHPIKKLAGCLASAFTARRGDLLSRAEEAERVREFVARVEGGPHELAELARELAETGSGKPNVLIVIDQAEELLTSTGPHQQQRFLGLIQGAMTDTSPLWAVATVRSESLSRAPERAGLAEAIDDTVFVEPLSRNRLSEVIARPAQRAGLEFAPGLIERMVEETAGGDALPLLAHTLSELYLRVGPERVFGFDDYEAIGGVVGSLQRHADLVRHELGRRGKDRLVLPTLLKLATVEGQADPTRRRLRRDTMSQDEQEVVQAFVDARLIVTHSKTAHMKDGDHEQDEDEEVTVEVAHEALLRQWIPLQEAINDSVASLRLRSELERAAADWTHGDRDESYLLRGGRLAAFDEWAGTHDDELTALEREFINQSKRSDRATLQRMSETAARQALSNVDRNPELSILLSIAALEECSYTSLAHRALLQALSSVRARAVLRGHDGPVRSLGWSPDGRRLVTSSDDGTARLWDAETQSETGIVLSHEDWVWGVAWSPDSTRIVTVSRDRTGRVWDANTGNLIVVLEGHTDWVRGAAWSPDSERIVTASEDGTARVWLATTGETLTVFSEHGAWVEDVAWSPDGSHVASVSGDRSGRVWRPDDGTTVAVLDGHEQAVMDVDWSPDSRHVLTVSRDRTARIWQHDTGLQLDMLRGHTDIALCAAWSPQGRYVATASGDRTVRVWDPGAIQDEVAVLRGHTDIIVGVAWSPDDRLLATAATDQTARLWSAERSSDLPVFRHESQVFNVAWSHDGRRVATTSADRTAAIWDAQGGRLLTLEGHSDIVWDACWAPGDRMIATSGDRTVRVWDADTGDCLRVLHAHDNVVRGAQWSPNGQLIATASSDNTACVWDASTWTKMATFTDHSDVLRDLAWSPDGQFIATASDDRTARIWVGKSGSGLRVLEGHGHWVRGVAWSLDGRLIATASDDQTVKVWEASSGLQISTLEGHEDAVRAVAWSRSGHVGTASSDRTVRLWEPTKNHCLGILAAHEDWVEALAWTANGRYLATASRDGSAQLWDTETTWEQWVEKARTRVFRRLTADERRSAMLPVGLDS